MSDVSVGNEDAERRGGWRGWRGWRGEKRMGVGERRMALKGEKSGRERGGGWWKRGMRSENGSVGKREGLEDGRDRGLWVRAKRRGYDCSRESANNESEYKETGETA
eukprot:2348324-Rhodomonas_salina.1